MTIDDFDWSASELAAEKSSDDLKIIVDEIIVDEIDDGFNYDDWQKSRFSLSYLVDPRHPEEAAKMIKGLEEKAKVDPRGTSAVLLRAFKRHHKFTTSLFKGGWRPKGTSRK